MPVEFNNLPGLGGKSNQPGLRKKVKYSPISDFATIAEPSTKETGLPTDVVIDGDHTFKPGKGFREMYTTLDTAKLLAESIGERDGKGFNTKVECWHPGTRAETLAFANVCQNEEYIILVEGLDGQWIQVGSERMGAEMTAAFDSGTVSSGRKGFAFNVDTFGLFTLYDGTITDYPVTN